MLLLRLSILLLVIHSTLAKSPIVRIEDGALEGSYLISHDGKKFAAFRGIPYSRPPIGEFRFQEPSPVQKWTGMWNATEYGSPCLQYDFTFAPDQEHVVGDEDCLFINVFTPKIPSSKSDQLYDVFVYIHGGAFVHGAGSLYGPKYLMDRDVVLVTFNYRLGVLGFLSTEDDALPGNNGLKDQTFALKWIKKNIHHFGGDPKRVTISGTSAGGASVHYHYLSPRSKGLFKAGMSFSGSALLPWAQGHNHRQKAMKVGALVGCDTHNSLELVECLKTRPARQIVRQTEHFQVWRFNPFNPFGPITSEPGKNPFLNKQPIDIMFDGQAQNLPWLTSITTEEGLYPVAEFAAKDDALEELERHFNDIAPHLFHYNYTASQEDKRDIAEQIRSFYLQGRSFSSDTRKELIQMAGDRIFVVDVERAARVMATMNSAPVYFYKFSYKGAESISNFMSRTNIDMGVAHADDTAYILDMIFCNTATTEEDRAVSNLLLDICVNFARNGDPTPTNRNIQWHPVQPKKKLLDYLSIEDSINLNMKSSSDLGNRKFWDSLPLNEPQIRRFKENRIIDEL